MDLDCRDYIEEKATQQYKNTFFFYHSRKKGRKKGSTQSKFSTSISVKI